MHEGRSSDAPGSPTYPRRGIVLFTPDLPLATQPFQEGRPAIPVGSAFEVRGSDDDPVDWSFLSVVLLTPSTIERKLQEEVLKVLQQSVFLTGTTTMTATEDQVMAYFADRLEPSAATSRPVLDVAAELRRTYVGQQVTVSVAFACGEMFDGPDAPDTATLVRYLIGHEDPAKAAPASIRGRFGQDSLAEAAEQGRLVESVIHSSATFADAEREFGIWLEPTGMKLQTWETF